MVVSRLAPNFCNVVNSRIQMPRHLIVTHMECKQMICHLTSDMGMRKRSKYNLLYELRVSGSKE